MNPIAVLWIQNLESLENPTVQQASIFRERGLAGTMQNGAVPVSVSECRIINGKSAAPTFPRTGLLGNNHFRSALESGLHCGKQRGQVTACRYPPRSSCQLRRPHGGARDKKATVNWPE